MTTNQTIDGVPRATAERIHACLEAHRYAESTKLAKELRALLDAPAINHDQKASDHQFYTAQLQARAAKVLRLDPENTSWFEVVGEMEKAAAQAQGEPVAHLILGETFYGTNGPEVGDFDIQYDHEACERLAKAFPGQQVALYAEQPAPDNALKDFANDMITAAFEGGSFDGGDIQDIAVKHGLLRIEQREEECGEVCACRSEGDGFPAECYRKTALLRGEQPAPVAVAPDFRMIGTEKTAPMEYDEP